ncbi:hypothetical protein JF110_001640 [Campylobacter jejuni]|nr:hypothetical protein [Campylobacter jejuni]
MMNLCMPLLEFDISFASMNNSIRTWKQRTGYLWSSGTNTANQGMVIGQFVYFDGRLYPYCYVYTGEHDLQGKPNSCDNSDDGTFISRFVIIDFLQRTPPSPSRTERPNEKWSYDSNKGKAIKLYNKYMPNRSQFTTAKIFLTLDEVLESVSKYFSPIKCVEQNRLGKFNVLRPNKSWIGYATSFSTCRGNAFDDRYAGAYFKALGYPPDIYKYPSYYICYGNVHFDTHGFSAWSEWVFECTYISN